MMSVEYKGYMLYFYYIEEEETYCGEIFGMEKSVLVNGRTIEKLKEAFHDAVDSCIGQRNAAALQTGSHEPSAQAQDAAPRRARIIPFDLVLQRQGGKR